MPVQIFLGNEIIDGVADPQARTFERSSINQMTGFNTQFFEAVPTMWASAYELEKLLETYVNPATGVAPTNETVRAVEEWMCLFVLYYFGVANFEIVQRAGGKLWTAMSRTYPKGKLNEVALLRVDDEGKTIIGASYPDIVFFPGRGRGAWSKSAVLKEYLFSGRLSWDLCKQKLLQNPQDENAFAAFLSNVKATIHGIGGGAIAKFAAAKGLYLPSPGVSFQGILPYQPDAGWKRAIEENVTAIMAAYPFVKEVRDGNNKVVERVYFLITGVMNATGQREDDLPDTDWTKAYIARGMPTPHAFYLKKDNTGRLRDRRIFIKWAGRELEYALTDNGEVAEEVVLVKDCFMHESAWCHAIDDKAFNTHIHRRHKLTNDEQSPVLVTQAAGSSYHLAPVTGKFLKHFGQELYEDSENHLVKISDIDRRAEDIGTETDRRPQIEWVFTFEVPERNDPNQQRKLKIKWTSEIGLKEFDTVSAAIWPPKVQKDWRLYFAYGRGVGSWKLFDENGEPAVKKLKGDDFLYISGEEGGQQKPNRPAALMFHDRTGASRGVLFLQKLADVGSSAGAATLGVDFGTSNTCLAYKLPGSGQAQVLKFTLAPAMMWGRTPTELPGFVPFRWHDKDFFSTVLLSDKRTYGFEQIQAAQLKPSDLFLTIDIPTLHQGLKEKLAMNSYKEEWHVKSDLKWREPLIFRDLFLSLTLLHAHAELLFTYGYEVGKCVFTFPLAFNSTRRENFERQTTTVYQRIAQLCYGKATLVAPGFLSESAAVAASQGTQNSFDLFIDIGGGSTDVALTYRTNTGTPFTALDSIEVAGKEFFEFVWDHFNGTKESQKQLRTDLNVLLHGKANELTITDENQLYLGEIGGFGYFYAFLISERSPADLAESEQKVREVQKEFYQHYRSQMFYQHILTYALIQACAAVTTDPALPQFIRILCTGNGWGMLTFAKWNKTQTHLTALANNILNSIKSALESRLSKVEQKRLAKFGISDVLFLGQPNAGHQDGVRYTAKTAVACGAVDADSQPASDAVQSDVDGNTASCYTGVTLGNVRVGDEQMGHVTVPVNWNDRWIFKKFSEPLRKERDAIAITQINDFQFNAANGGESLDSLLKLFFNTYLLDKTWATQKWHDLNTVTLDAAQYSAQNYQMPASPLNRFLAEALYGNRRSILRELAEKLGKL